MVVKTDLYIYVMEFKVDKPASEASPTSASKK